MKIENILLGILLSVSQISAFAQEGPKVGGDVDISAVVGPVTQGISGDENTAVIHVGAVTGGTVEGDVTIDVQAEAVTQLIEGSGNSAEILIGVVGPSVLNQ